MWPRMYARFKENRTTRSKTAYRILYVSLAPLPPAELVRARSNARALEVPGVAQADTQLSRLEKRILSGTIRITTETGETADVTV